VTVTEGQLLWTPSAEFASGTNVARYLRWLGERGIRHDGYESLRRWSVSDPAAFWGTIWDYFDVDSAHPYERVIGGGPMPRTRWFPGARVNLAQHVLRHETVRRDEPAVISRGELRAPAQTTWGELGDAVRAVATALRARGVRPGDRVVSYMPNIVETLVAMLATTAIGAVWASAAPEFGASFVIDRFAQVAPKAIFVADGYRFAGKAFDRSNEVRAIVAGLPSLALVVTLPYLDSRAALAFDGIAAATWNDLAAEPAPGAAAFAFHHAGEDDPLWILFSSGTTGLPKAIVHSHVGILVEAFKNLGFHADLGPASTMFFYTTTGWMMWNALVSSLLLGAKIVLYDGHPMHPGPDLLWSLAAETGATCFGSSPTFVKQMRDHGIVPRERFDLSALELIFLAGSPATPESFSWLYENVKADLWVTSQSGGTEFCSGLAVGVPILPVYAGEIQSRALGIDVRVWNEAGNDVVDEIGELVVAAPCPSMPLYLWNDPGDERYRATYFDRYPGVWRHGDFAKINARGGVYVYGRSDATLNRYGVRIGSAEIYRALEELDGVADALIVCLELPNGDFYMPLFVRAAAGAAVDDALQARIVAQLRRRCSPRHVPDDIHGVPAIPYTLSAKKMEIPVRRILAGFDPGSVVDRQSLADPTALDWFVAFAREAPQLAQFRTVSPSQPILSHSGGDPT
jgi:acetoacetyl-CoA synthetase